MRRTALILVGALAAGLSAGFVAQSGRADGAGTARAPASRDASVVNSQPATRPAASRSRSQTAPRLHIPRLDLDTRIFTARKLDHGPAWWPVTGRPGGGDTIAVAGHRTTHSRPFYSLDLLRHGDVIRVTYEGQGYIYRVSRIRVISAENMHIADAVGHERLLLTSCTPRGSAAFRLVVEALPV
jgi:LPXTG-site transpeptidase (sortase) family protein